MVSNEITMMVSMQSSRGPVIFVDRDIETMDPHHEDLQGADNKEN